MEGLVYNDREHENPCFDTTSLKGHVITFWIIYKFVYLKKITGFKNHQKRVWGRMGKKMDPNGKNSEVHKYTVSKNQKHSRK